MPDPDEPTGPHSVNHPGQWRADPESQIMKNSTSHGFDQHDNAPITTAQNGFDHGIGHPRNSCPRWNHLTH
jgi:hypothetical protein